MILQHCHTYYSLAHISKKTDGIFMKILLRTFGQKYPLSFGSHPNPESECGLQNRIIFALVESLPYPSVFTSLHGMQTRSSDDNSVRPSVCLSVRPSVTPSEKVQLTLT